MGHMRVFPPLSEALESDSEEAVFSGTRLKLRHVAAMLCAGASEQELAEEYDLTASQIAAARQWGEAVGTDGSVQLFGRKNLKHCA